MEQRNGEIASTRPVKTKARTASGIEFLPGTIKSYANANWKFGVENFIGDAYHAWWTHDSGGKAMMGGAFPAYDPTDTFHASVNGHGWEFALEGFGDIAMAQRTFELMRSHDGRMASVNGATQIRAGVMRPEIVIPLDAAHHGSGGGPAAAAGGAGLKPATRVLQ